MAEERINISVGSEANLSGLHEASRATQTLGKAGKSSKEALGELSGTLSSMGGPVGEVVKGVENMSKAIAAFGIAGVAIGSVKLAIDMYASSTAKAAEELKELTDAMERRSSSRFSDAISRHVSEVKAQINALSTGAKQARADFDRLEASAAKIAATLNRINQVTGRGTITDLQVEKLNAIIAAESESAAKVVAAQHDLRIAREKAKQAEEASAAAVQAATKQQEVRSESLARASRATEEAEAVLAYANRKLAEARASGVTRANGLDKFEAEVERATAALTSARADEAKALDALKEQDVQVMLALQERETQKKQNDLDLLAATKNLTDAENAAAQALKKQAEESEKAAKATEERLRREEAQENAAIHEEEIKARGAFWDKQLKDELDALNKRITDAEKSADRSKAGMNADRRVSDFGPAYDYDLDANGNINDFVDWQRAQRFGGRAARDQKTADRVNAAQEKKAADLQKKLDEGKKLGENEKKFLDDWNKFNDERNRAKLQKQAEELNKQIAANTKKMADDLRQVKENLKTALEVK